MLGLRARSFGRVSRRFRTIRNRDPCAGAASPIAAPRWPKQVPFDFNTLARAPSRILFHDELYFRLPNSYFVCVVVIKLFLLCAAIPIQVAVHRVPKSIESVPIMAEIQCLIFEAIDRLIACRSPTVTGAIASWSPVVFKWQALDGIHYRWNKHSIKINFLKCKSVVLGSWRRLTRCKDWKYANACYWICSLFGTTLT